VDGVNLLRWFDLDALGALVSVVVIDLVLAGDNAVVVGMAAAGLPRAEQRRVIAIGIVAATALRVALALVAQQLLAIIGLTLAGGILLLWVAWKTFRDLRPKPGAAAAADAPKQPRSFRQALFRVVLADVSMSLDNILAVAGSARDHFAVLVIGLLLSVALMGVASTIVARLLERYRWIGWIGLAVVTIVALRMVYDGSAEVLQRI
jgi:YjbE family integral membrane protein